MVGKKRPVGGGAPVVGGEGVQVMRVFGGVRFSVGGEARGRRGRRRDADEVAELGALVERARLGVASVDDEDKQKHVKKVCEVGLDR